MPASVRLDVIGLSGEGSQGKDRNCLALGGFEASEESLWAALQSDIDTDKVCAICVSCSSSCDGV